MTAMNTLTKNDCGNSTFAPHRGMYSALDAKEDENMACKWGEKKNMTILLAVSLVLLIGGVTCGLLLPKEAHLSSRIAGFFSGMGGSFTAISLVGLVRRRLIGEARAKDSELAATDERGQLIALKAQNILALCVTFSMCAMVVVATVRGDTLYMLLGGVLLLLSAAGKAAAAYLYGKQL